MYCIFQFYFTQRIFNIFPLESLSCGIINEYTNEMKLAGRKGLQRIVVTRCNATEKIFNKRVVIRRFSGRLLFNQTIITYKNRDR